ncbi:DUF5693 family protein [Gottschalkiaceae bacterium SANA]|nr:DUF5693 family protein [Gottschalkiaceae bacterium SANA]
MDIKKNRGIALLLIGLMISAVALAVAGMGRIKLEAEHKTISLALDYEEMEKMADQSEDDLITILTAFREMDASYVGIEEESLRDYLGANPALQGQIAQGFFGNDGPVGEIPIELILAYEAGQVHPYDYVITITDPMFAGDFSERVLARFHESDLQSFWSDQTEYLVISGSRELGIFEQSDLLIDGQGRKYFGQTPIIGSRIEDIGFGFDPKAMEKIELAGLQAMPKVRNNPLNPEMAVAALQSEFDRYGLGNSPLLLTQETPGYPTDVVGFSNVMEERNFTLALIESGTQREHIVQKGMFTLLDEAENKAVRLFSVWPYIQERYQYYNYQGGQEIGNALYRAATERNIRILYFKPFKWAKENYVTDLEEYRPIFADLTNRLGWHNLAWGNEPSTFPNRQLSMGILFLLGMGPVLVAILILRKLFYLSEKKLMLLALGLLMIMAAGLAVKRDLMQSLLAFGASFTYSSLAGIWMMDRLERAGNSLDSRISLCLWEGAKALIQSVAIAMMGGLYVGTILSDTTYFLELSIFRGVKASLVLPLFVVALYGLRVWGYRRETKERGLISDLERLSKEPLRIGHLLVAGAFLAMAYVYLARSGHETSLQPLNIEMLMRNGLENLIPARPRTKEILMAFPAVILSFSLVKNGLKWLGISLGMLATIGLISVTNTFSHLRTPMILSIERTGYSLSFGLVIGCIGTWIILTAIQMIRHRRRA